MNVRSVVPADTEGWLQMREALWPDAEEGEHRETIGRFFAGELREPLATLVAESDDGSLVGFAELSIRAYAENCRTDRVAYLEGWFVVPASRGRGVGRALVEAAEDWGRARGCTEFASDSEADNDASIAAHRALGFADVGLIRCFRKEL